MCRDGCVSLRDKVEGMLLFAGRLVVVNVQRIINLVQIRKG